MDARFDNPFSGAVLENLDESLQGRVLLQDGVLHWSSELRGNMMLDTLAARLKRRGIMRFEQHKPEDFNKNYRALLSSAVSVKTDNDIQRKAVELLHTAYREEASDIHITHYGPYALVGFRSLGMVRDYTQLPGEEGERVLAAIYQNLSQSGDATFSPSERQDARITDRRYLPVGVHSVRIHTEPIQSTYSADGTGSYMALRLLYDATKAAGTLEQRLGALGFTAEQQKIFRGLTQRTGLNIISGPTGHGKTTALKQVMESMAEYMPEKNYMSIEDPPEYPLIGVKQILVSTKTLEEEEREARYAAAIAGLMRSDLDVGMVGEIRYRSAAQASIEAALTGHGIWSTVHASNALAIISRFQEMGISLSSLCNQNVLSGLSYQRLIPLLCPQCKVPLREHPEAIPADTLGRLERVSGDLGQVYVRGEGCEYCRHVGNKGQTVAAEVVAVDHTLLRYLRNEDLLGAHEYWTQDLGGMTHVAHALRLIDQGLIDPFLAEMRLGVTLDHDDSFATSRRAS